MNLRCSTCRENKPEDEFPPKRYHQTSHYTKEREMRTYKYPSRRGRAYECRACKSAKTRKPCS